MKTYRVYRTVVRVEYAHVTAENEETAQREAEDNPNGLHWEFSSHNDPSIMEIVELT